MLGFEATSQFISGKSGPEKMGGRGSGRQASLGFMVDKCHEYKSIDIAWLHRQKLLQMGRTSTITWSFRDKQTGSIGIARLPGGI